MGTSMLCDCKCQDSTTENLTQKEHDVTSFNNTTILKSHCDKRIENDADFITKKKPTDLYKAKRNAAAIRITNLFRLCMYRKIAARQHDNAPNANSKQYFDIENYSSFTEKKIRTKKLCSNNHTYIGNKINNNKDGFGIQIGAEGGKYVGYFKNNKAEGYGIFTAEGDKYEGQFSQDISNGFGKYTHLDGAYYLGYWKNDLQDLYGYEQWADGSTYQGEFIGGKKHGIGKYKWADGTTYEGEWNQNNLEGYGIYYFNENKAYLGEWKNNLKDGFGDFIWQDKRYIGFYSKDKKSGFGIYYWKESNKAYIGFWKDGKQEGFGKYLTEKKCKFGIWKLDNKVQWLNHEKDYQSYLKKQENIKYQKLFNYSLHDLNNVFSRNDNIDIHHLENFRETNIC